MHCLDRLDYFLGRQQASNIRQQDLDEIRTSIASLIEFSATRWSWRQTHGEDLLKILPVAAQSLPLPQTFDRLWLHSSVDGGEVHEIPWALEEWASGTSFSFFQERFKDGLTTRKVPGRFAAALCGALAEMASNAREHSMSPLPPLASYQFTPDQWSFSVTDVGCGVLSSLRRNPSYAALNNEVAALREALKDGVSSTGVRDRGRGFSDLFKGLVNKMCTLRFRSSGAAASWEGQSPAAHNLRLTPLPIRAGFHVCVSAPLLA